MKIIEVNNCHTCPYTHYRMNGDYICGKNTAIIVNEETDNLTIHPSCPLKDASQQQFFEITKAMSGEKIEDVKIIISNDNPTVVDRDLQSAFNKYSDHIITDDMDITYRDFSAGWDAAVKNLDIPAVIGETYPLDRFEGFKISVIQSEIQEEGSGYIVVNPKDAELFPKEWIVKRNTQQHPGNDTIEFAQWILEGNLIKCNYTNGEIRYWDDNVNHSHSVKELYELYINRPVKK